MLSETGGRGFLLGHSPKVDRTVAAVVWKEANLKDKFGHLAKAEDGGRRM